VEKEKPIKSKGVNVKASLNQRDITNRKSINSLKI
jgi:hypothetical protein